MVQRREGLRLHHADDGSEDVFVHHTAIVGSGFKSLADGAKVSYGVGQGPKGLAAADVKSV